MHSTMVDSSVGVRLLNPHVQTAHQTCVVAAKLAYTYHKAPNKIELLAACGGLRKQGTCAV